MLNISDSSLELRGRLKYRVSRLRQFREQLREAPLTAEMLEIGLALGLPHPDPADRFLAATAKVLDLTLVTADENLLNLSEIVTLPNR